MDGITYFRYSDAHKVEQENCCHSLQGRSIPHPRSTTSLSVHSSGLKWNLVSKQMQKKKREKLQSQRQTAHHHWVELKCDVRVYLAHVRATHVVTRLVSDLP